LDPQQLRHALEGSCVVRAPHHVGDLLDRGVCRRQGRGTTATTTSEAYGKGEAICRRHDAPMPTWLIERGFRFGIFAADCNEPPHVHVQGHGGRGKLWLSPARIADLRGYTQMQRATIVGLLAQHHDMFLERWHEFCCEQAKD
jgi:hypothetical protein